MSDFPSDLLYTEEHEYLKATGEEGVYIVGITDYAQGELGDVVFVELPEAGASFNKMDVFGTIEAVKAVSDLYCPVDGEILDVNHDLDDEPSRVNDDPYGKGWMVRMRVTGPLEGLMNADAYEGHVGG